MTSWMRLPGRPRLPGREIARGEALAACGELEAAAECFERAAGSRSAGSPSGWRVRVVVRARAAWRELAEAHAHARRLPEAERALERALAHDGEDPDARLMRARVRHRAGRFDEAIDDLHAVIASIPPDPGPYLLFAACADGGGDRGFATVALNQALRVANAVLAGRGLGEPAGVPGGEARDRVRSPRIPAGLPATLEDDGFHRAAWLEARGRSDEAEDLLDRRSRAGANRVEGLRLAAAIHLRQGRPRRSIESIAEALRLGPGGPDLHADAAAAHWALGSRGAAAACLERALDANRDLGRAHRLLALVHASRGRMEEGLRSAARGFVRERDLAAPTLAPPRHPLARWGSIARALAHRPDHADLHHLHALQHRARGDRAGARRALERALALNPRYDAAALECARLDLEEGRVDEAHARLALLERSRPEWADVHLLLGRSLRLGGDPWGAVASLGRALTLSPDSREARDELARGIEDRRRRLARDAAAARVPSGDLSGEWALPVGV